MSQVSIEFTGKQALGGPGPSRNVTTMLANEMRNVGKAAAGMDFDAERDYTLTVLIAKVPVATPEPSLFQEGESLSDD